MLKSVILLLSNLFLFLFGIYFCSSDILSFSIKCLSANLYNVQFKIGSKFFLILIILRIIYVDIDLIGNKSNRLDNLLHNKPGNWKSA